MSRLLIGFLKNVGRRKCFPKSNVFSSQLSRGEATKAVSNQISVLQENSWNPSVTFPEKTTNLFKLPEHLSFFFPTWGKFPQKHHILDKPLPSTLYSNIMDIYQDQEPVGILDEVKTDSVYHMGSLLKKRRKKMNRQKYKKRRKRDRFKREALKNLREKKRQRKERAFERSQSMLSKMVLNKTISKRRVRYLGHKLLPGVVKVQNTD